ncbi:unnamed protein product [Ranitomeya imitator]|uniref:Uncharacterized protein n=1 Tax=Ranitomeya imitator TaxID=111125 RepID=A0ABN9LN82_9NEOB|nr:unnamed protein product [Ranitomeya imitator]
MYDKAQIKEDKAACKGFTLRSEGGEVENQLTMKVAARQLVDSCGQPWDRLNSKAEKEIPARQQYTPAQPKIALCRHVLLRTENELQSNIAASMQPAGKERVNQTPENPASMAEDCSLQIQVRRTPFLLRKRAENSMGSVNNEIIQQIVKHDQDMAHNIQDPQSLGTMRDSALNKTLIWEPLVHAPLQTAAATTNVAIALTHQQNLQAHVFLPTTFLARDCI